MIVYFTTSHVNITNVKEEDGGEYMCTAQNIIGKYVRILDF